MSSSVLEEGYPPLPPSMTSVSDEEEQDREPPSSHQRRFRHLRNRAL
jgi:hypothetical protein